MAANQAVINSAKAAYDIPKEMYDVSGYISGVAAIAQGLIAGKQKSQLEIDKFNKRKFKTNLEPVKAMAVDVKAELALGTIDVEEATDIFDSIALSLNDDIPNIEKIIGKLLSVGGDRFSDSANPILEAYSHAYANGEWDKPITVDGKDYPSFWTLEKDPTKPGKMKMKVVGADGTYVDPHILLASLQNQPKVSDGSLAHQLTSNFGGQTFKNRDIWQANVNEALNDLHNMFKNENAKMSFLIDYTHVVDGETTSFTDYYIKNALGDKVDIEKYENAIGALEGDVGQKTKNMLATQLMKKDKFLDDDIDEFLNNLFESKKPDLLNPKNYGKTSSGYPIGTENDTESDVMAGNRIAWVEEMVKQVHVLKNSPKMTLEEKDKKIKRFNRDIGGNLGVELVPMDSNEPNKKYRFQRNLYGETNADDTLKVIALTTPFDPTNLIELNNMMPQILTNVARLSAGNKKYMDYMNYIKGNAGRIYK
jgi:hypothetical protein